MIGTEEEDENFSIALNHQYLGYRRRIKRRYSTELNTLIVDIFLN